MTTIRAGTPMFLLARKIKAMGIKMVMSGEGADETLAGYLYFHKAPDGKELHEECVRKVADLHKCVLAPSSTAPSTRRPTPRTRAPTHARPAPRRAAPRRAAQVRLPAREQGVDGARPRDPRALPGQGHARRDGTPEHTLQPKCTRF